MLDMITEAMAEGVPLENDTSKSPKLNSNDFDMCSEFEEAREHPAFVIRMKYGRYTTSDDPPSLTTPFVWYMECWGILEIKGLMTQLKVPGRRWFANERETYDLMKEVGCVTSGSEGEPFVVVRTGKGSPLFWFGRRHQRRADQPIVVLLCLAELCLKSATHLIPMKRRLVHDVQRVLPRHLVLSHGHHTIAVRGDALPTVGELSVLSMIPGIAKMYRAVPAVEGSRQFKCGESLGFGAGGIPMLRHYRVLALMSGGIDSPVAAYRMMCRGCTVSLIHFLNSTADMSNVMEKNGELARLLSCIQGHVEMVFVDIGSVQQQIVAHVANQHRSLLYKHMMLQLAARWDSDRYAALVVGDSVGQVASQTLQNIQALYASCPKVVLAPLIGVNKQEIIRTATRMGTFDVSTRPAEDCCRFMMTKGGATLAMGSKALTSLSRHIRTEALPIEVAEYFNGTFLRRRHGTWDAPRAAGHGDVAGAPMPPPMPRRVRGGDVLRFDCAAGTAVHPTVAAAMSAEVWGNPNALYASGRAARAAIERTRRAVAEFFDVRARDVVFTSGGTESNGLALARHRVVREAWSHASTAGTDDGGGSQRPAVLVVDLVHHETGSVTPPPRKRPEGVARVHVDACQAVTKVDVRGMVDWGVVDSLAFTARKFHGPTGCGVLIVRDLPSALASGTVAPLVGGAPRGEGGLRAGTENVAAIVGLGAALAIDRRGTHAAAVDATLRGGLAAMGLPVNARGATSRYILHTTLPEGFESAPVVARLSEEFGIEVGTGSACKTGAEDGSVYATLGLPPTPSRGLRLSWEFQTTVDDAEELLHALAVILKKRAKPL